MVRNRLAPCDAVLIEVTIILLVIGVIAVFDASYASSMQLNRYGRDGYYFLKRQLAFGSVGVVAMALASRFGYWRLRRLAIPLLGLTFVALICVWLPHIGHMKNGAYRWVGAGALQFQPSELAKLSAIIYLSALLSRNAFDLRKATDGLPAPLCIMGLFVVLIEREPDLGTAVVLAGTCIALLFVAGARLRHLATICAIGGALMLVVTLSAGHRSHRLATYLNPESNKQGAGYQVWHGMLAVGTGGIRGVGIGAGREKFYLPEANTDFIFATIAEETGLLGSVAVIGLMFLLSWRAVLIARKTTDPFGMLLATGIAAMISLQAMINMAVVTNSIPATGVPLPFVSYGGTSLVFLLASVGILLNVSRNPQGQPREVQGESGRS